MIFRTCAAAATALCLGLAAFSADALSRDELLRRLPSEWGGEAILRGEGGEEASISFCLRMDKLGETPRDAAMAQLRDYPYAEDAVLFTGVNVYERADTRGVIETAGAVSPDGSLVVIEVHGTGQPPDGGWVTEGAWLGRIDDRLLRLKADWTPFDPTLYQTIDLTPGCSKTVAALETAS